MASSQLTTTRPEYLPKARGMHRRARDVPQSPAHIVNVIFSILPLKVSRGDELYAYFKKWRLSHSRKLLPGVEVAVIPRKSASFEDLSTQARQLRTNGIDCPSGSHDAVLLSTDECIPQPAAKV